MAEETDVKTEVVAQEASQEVAQEEEKTQVEAKETEESKKTDEKVNWAKTRELLESQKKELEALKASERRYQEKLAEIAKAQQQPEEDELSKLSDDDILTKRQAEKLAERKAKKLLEEFDNQRGEDRARQEISDYDTYVNQENLEKLQKDHPEVVEALKATPHLYTKAKSAYKFLKAFYGQSNVDAAANKENLEKNMAKPRSVSSLGSTGALSQAHAFERGLTPELRKQLLQEMISASKRT